MIFMWRPKSLWLHIDNIPDDSITKNTNEKTKTNIYILHKSGIKLLMINKNYFRNSKNWNYILNLKK